MIVNQTPWVMFDLQQPLSVSCLYQGPYTEGFSIIQINPNSNKWSLQNFLHDTSNVLYAMLVYLLYTQYILSHKEWI